MDCQKCNATFEAAEAGDLTYGQAAVPLLKDWKTWVLGIVILLPIMFLCEGVGLAPGWGAGIGGGLYGLVFFYRLQGLKKCPKCGAAVRISSTR